jgi:hypothetical protein
MAGIPGMFEQSAQDLLEPTADAASFSRSRVSGLAANWLKRDAIAILIYVITVVAMTYPLVITLDRGLTGGMDILSSLWQRWWLEQAVANGFNPNFAHDLFHPVGLDVTFQPRRWTGLFVWTPLVWLFGPVAGHNLNALLGLVFGGYAAYLLVLYLTKNRLAALIGGAFFAFYPQHITDALAQPNVGSIQWIPVFVLALLKGLRAIEQSPPESKLSKRLVGFMALTAAALSLSGYLSIKVWVFAMFTGALLWILVPLVGGFWRRRIFWQAFGVFFITSLILILPIVTPYFQAAWIDVAIEQVSPSDRPAADLMSYFKSTPALPPGVPRGLYDTFGVNDARWPRGPFYVGLTSILLVIAALISMRSQPRLYIWLLIALIFWVLSLGVSLRVNRQTIDGIWLPYQLLESNPLFKAIRNPHRFAHAFVLPWAVLIGFGASGLMSQFRNFPLWGKGLAGLLGVLMLVEISLVPLDIKRYPVSDFNETLRQSDEQGAIIDLPIQQPKLWMYYQTYHQRPVAVGKAARMPADADRYLHDNPLLLAWMQERAPECNFDMGEAVDQLVSDGFQYVILHQNMFAYEVSLVEGYFTGIEPVYQDRIITVYDVADLKGTTACSE